MMKILILGGGLMGPAAAYNVLTDPGVEQVAVADISHQQLTACAALLKDKDGAEKVRYVTIDLANINACVELMREYDAIVAALPRPVNMSAIRAAIRAGVPLVDLAQTYPAAIGGIAGELSENGPMIVLGCGVEPGLTEIVARHLAEKLDHVDELHIKCGGIPENPEPPLGYKIVFGGRKMPLRESDSEIVRDGQIAIVPRYSGIEQVTFPGVGRCEAWHEGFKPWILDIPALSQIKKGTQKTVRWPGYAEKITVLKELGLLSLDPVVVDGQSVVPKHLVDSVLYPRVQLKEGERDITCFRVELSGEKDNRPACFKAEMVDRYDTETGFTSMARTTAFTGAIVARMIASGRLAADNSRIVTPEKVIHGPAFEQLMAELAAMNILIEISENI